MNEKTLPLLSRKLLTILNLKAERLSQFMNSQKNAANYSVCTNIETRSGQCFMFAVFVHERNYISRVYVFIVYIV